MSEFKVEKGIPIPSINNDSGFRETLRKLEVGDSFEIPDDVKRVATWRASANTVGFRIGAKFSWRGRRVWRIS